MKCKQQFFAEFGVRTVVAKILAQSAFVHAHKKACPSKSWLKNEKANFASLIWMKCKQQFFAEVAEFGVCLVGTNIIEYYIMLKQTLNKAIKV